jgi:hypothetical protein
LAFSLLAPSDGAFLNDSLVVLDWQDAVDVDPCDTISYDLYVSLSPVFSPESTMVFADLAVSTHVCDLEEGKYFWKVRAFDGHEEIWSSQIWEFEIDLLLAPVGIWHFNEGFGDIAYDSSKYGNNGILHNAPQWVTTLPPLETGLKLDGVDDYIDCGNHLIYEISNEATIMMWVKFSAPPGPHVCLISRNEGAGGHYKWNFGYSSDYGPVQKSMHFHINFEGLPGIWLMSEVLTIQPDRWYHFSVVKRNLEYEFFLNGVSCGVDTAGYEIPAINASLEIGRSEGAFYFNGTIDEVWFFRRALTAEEIFQKFREGFICGDVNIDSIVDVSDAVYIINYVFIGGNQPIPMESGDVNCDETVDVSDAVWIINYVFVGGPAPCDC